ncbi:MAG TPA: Tol-Pal system beta propeller repeat protein TolB [Burkholderiaceae bacterium]|jgi:TolB protein|nr:Tol-Pal system beta propeller repeat protein TolB [Burkholderiaceae bacterium]
MWHRRNALRALGATLAWPALTPAYAQFRVEISGVGGTQIPVAVGRFRGEEGFPQALSTIVRADLERCGLFRIVDAPVPADETGSPDYGALRTASTDAVVAGSAARLADGRIDVRYRLWDVVKGSDLGGMSYPVVAGDLRLAAHRVADQIYEKLTGEKGIFSTRVAFVTKAGTTYTLYATDADGENKQKVLISREPIISPAWSPDGKELAYVSFTERKAVVYSQNLAASSQHVIANYRGSNSAPAFSPDGGTLAATLSKDGGSQLYLMNRDGTNVRRFTQSAAIDTEAKFSPDGKTLYFVSDRGGGPQVYRKAIIGGDAERVTFQGSYNISPALSPDGKLLAYITRQGGSVFKVMVMDLATGNVRSITDTSDDESPSFAPNSRFIVYSTRTEGRDVLMMSSNDGRGKAVLGESGTQYREPTWGPFGR